MKLDPVIDEIKRANLIEDVVKEYVPEFQGVQGDCPWHESKGHACFNINVSQQFFKCFHCEEKGDVINFVMKQLNCDFREALRVLAHRAGIALPEYTEEQQNTYDRRQRVFEILTEAAEFFYSHAISNKVPERLEKQWGINGDMIDNLKIGWSPADDDLVVHLRTQGFTDEEIGWAGLYPYIWKNRIVFPYWRNGKVVYFISRSTELTSKIKNTKGEEIDAPKYVKLKSNNYVSNDYFYNEDGARNAKDLFLTEGVTDCIAGMQAELSCISPVTVRFKKDDYPKMLILCRGVERVFVVNDNELNDAGLKGALDTVRFLCKNGVDARLITLPRDPSQPKIDLNDYLKNKTVDEFYTECVDTSQNYIEYQIRQIPTNVDKFQLPTLLNDVLAEIAELDELGEMKYVNVFIKDRFKLKEKELDQYRKIFRRHQRELTKNPEIDSDDFIANVKKSQNRYWVSRKNGTGKDIEVPISNFIVNILSQHGTPEGITRQVQFVRDDGKSEGPFMLEPKDMSRNDAFIQYCHGKGKFVWNGNMQDLAAIWSAEYELIDDRVVHDMDHMGWVSEEKVWIFNNLAITEDGRVIKPDPQGVFWDQDRGIKVKSIVVNTEKVSSSNLSEEEKVKLPEILEKFSGSIGEENAKILIGWVASVPFMEEIIHDWECFPFLFVTGKYQSGKSTIMTWITSFFSQKPKSFTVSETTSVAVQRYLSYYSCLPLFLDEYSNEKKVQSKEGFFRSVYRRDSAGKGIRSTFGVREGDIRGTLAIAGETTPTDAALISRCVKLFISQLDRKEDNFAWFNDNKKYFSYHFYKMLQDKHQNIKKFNELMHKKNSFLRSKGKIEQRVAMHYAMILAGYNMLFGSDEKFDNFIIEEAKRINQENEQQSAVVKFLEDLNSMKTLGTFKHSGKLWGTKNNIAYLYIQGLYNLWTKELRMRGDTTRFDKTAICNYLKEDAGFEEMRVSFKINKQTCSCMTFNTDFCDSRISDLVEEETMMGAGNETN
jgi:DNA primase catalytic core